MSFEKDIAEVKKLVEDYDGISPMLTAAHQPENVALVWWYNIVNGQFKADKSPTASHSDSTQQEFIKTADLKQWVRGRVFKFEDKCYLIVYWPEERGVTPTKLRDILDKCENELPGAVITRFIDSTGKDISDLFEGYMNVVYEKSTLGGWTVSKGSIVECMI